MSVAPALFPSGVILGRFEVGAVLGIGGTGTVFRAHDRERHVDVAVKAIPQDATLRQRARREASVGGRLSHPHVVTLHEVLEDSEYVYVVSQLVEGGDLAAALREGSLVDATRVRIVAAVCDALAHAHAHGVVHRDVKPANVLLGSDGSVKLADFGIAALADPDATVDDRLLGTLSYMAPEACRGEPPRAAADVWAAGVLLYESLTGANPFRARTPDELVERQSARVRPLGTVRPGLPKGLVAACTRALATNPSRRPTAAELRDALALAAAALDAGSSEPAARRRQGAAVVPLRPAAARRPAGSALRSAGRGVAAGARRAVEAIGASHVPAPVLARARGVAVRLGPAVLAGAGALAVVRTFPFWPASFVAPIAVTCAVAALLSPWAAAALVAAVAVPAVGNLSAGLAWALGLVAVAWLAACAGAGRRALLPLLAPLAAATLAWPAYLALAGTGRRVLGRALAGAAGAVAVALWRAGPHAAAPLAGVGDLGHTARQLAAGGGAPLLGQALVWAAAAASWPLVWRARPVLRGTLLAAWLALLVAGQALVPPLLGRPVEPAWASVAAPWLLGIVVLMAADLRGRAPGDA